MAIDYSLSAIPKGTPQIVDKVRKKKLDQQSERACREIVRKRDKGKCRIPGCKEPSAHLHHIVYRSKSKRLRWRTENCVWLCVEHHRLEHAGVITITGNADDEIIITGNVGALKFRL